MHVCVCGVVWRAIVFIHTCVPVYQGTACLFHISSSLRNTKDEAQPNMIAFNVSHKSLSCVCVRADVCERGGEGCSCTHSEKKRFKSLTPLIKASHYNTNKQSKSIHTSICEMYECNEKGVSEGQFAGKDLSSSEDDQVLGCVFLSCVLL